jgi:hypothetical protein
MSVTSMFVPKFPFAEKTVRLPSPIGMATSDALPCYTFVKRMTMSFDTKLS